MEKRERKPNGFWTKERCYEAAREYGSRNEFKENCSGGYYAARKNKWLDEFFPKRERKPRVKWTKEECYRAARECKNRFEFQKKYKGGYDAARRNKWLDDWFGGRRKPRGFWTKEECYRAARECGSRSEFEEKHIGGYNAARKNKWLDEFFPKRERKPNRFWTKEECYRAARECNTRTEFSENCRRGYEVARKNNWLGDYWWFERHLNPFTDKMDNVYCYYFTEFKSVYVGRTINPQQRDCHHRSSSAVCRFARKNKTEVPEMVLLETNLSLEDGLELEDYYVNKFKKEGWNVLNKAKTGKECGSIGSLGNGKWTKEECYRAARECNTRTEFSENCRRGYEVARKNNWFSEYDWFEENKKPNGFWTKEECYRAAREYKTRSEFQKNCKGGYEVARKNKWLDELFLKRSIKWTKEECYRAASDYNTRSEFYKNCQSGYAVALRNGWLDELFPKNKKSA